MINNLKKKIIVTGGVGYIGSHTVVELQQKGYEVIIIDNLSNSFGWVVDKIAEISGIKPAFYNFDLCDFAKLKSFFNTIGKVDAVIHFAAFKAVGESVNLPLKYYRNNIFSLVNLLEAMQDAGLKNLVFSSSCTVYGQPDKMPVTENAPVKKAFSPYGKTKQIAEDIIEDFTNVTNIKTIALRYFNPIGSHDSAIIGELPIGIPNNLIPYLTQTAIGKRNYLRVFGNDWNTPDGYCVRDYIHVVDLAKAHVIAVERLLEEKTKLNMEVFNLGTGTGYSVLEVIKAFEKVSGLKLNYQVVERRSGDIEQVWADTTFANKELGWKAKRDLDNMLLTAWNWEKALKEKEEK